MNHIEQLKLRVKWLRQKKQYHKAATLELILRDEMAKYGVKK